MKLIRSNKQKSAQLATAALFTKLGSSVQGNYFNKYLTSHSFLFLGSYGGLGCQELVCYIGALWNSGGRAGVTLVRKNTYFPQNASHFMKTKDTQFLNVNREYQRLVWVLLKNFLWQTLGG